MKQENLETFPMWVHLETLAMWIPNQRDTNIVWNSSHHPKMRITEQVRHWHIVTSCFDVFNAGYFTPSISSESSDNEEMTERRADDWLKLQLKVGSTVPGVLSVVPPPDCAPSALKEAIQAPPSGPIQGAAKMKEPFVNPWIGRVGGGHNQVWPANTETPLTDATKKRIENSRDEALKRKQIAEGQMSGMETSAPIEGALKEMRLTGSGLGDCGFRL